MIRCRLRGLGRLRARGLLLFHAAVARLARGVQAVFLAARLHALGALAGAPAGLLGAAAAALAPDVLVAHAVALQRTAGAQRRTLLFNICRLHVGTARRHPARRPRLLAAV